MPLRKKRSLMWIHFEEGDDGKTAKCKVCASSIAYHGNTSNLRKHLMSVHPAINLDEAVDVKQVKLDAMTKYLPGSSRQESITKKLVKMIAVDLQPVSLVEDTGFRELMDTMDKRYTIPSRRTLMRDLIPQAYKEICGQVKAQLDSASDVMLTTDIWSSRAGQGYIGVTAHIIANWELKSFVLATNHFKEDHTGANIASVLKSIAKEWGIVDKVRMLVSDSASNMVLAARILRNDNWTHLPCMAHKLNLVVQDSKAEDKELTSIIEKVKKTVSFFHHSTKASESLTEMQQTMKLEAHNLINDVPTRWNSTLDMMERMVEQHRAVNAVLAVLGRVELAIKEEHVEVMNGSITGLKPFKLVTSILSGEKYTTLGTVIPYMRGLNNMLDGVKRGRTSLVQSLKNEMKRFGKMEDDRYLAISTLLDPRYRRDAFQNENIMISHRRALQSEVAALIKREKDDKQTTAAVSREESKEQKGPPNDLQLLLGFMSKKQTSTNCQDTTAAAIVECDSYFRAPCIDKTGDPAAFLRDNEGNFPHLCKLAKKYTFCPATSVPCERLFSTAGDIISFKRARLSPENVHRILFLNKNM